MWFDIWVRGEGVDSGGGGGGGGTQNLVGGDT